VRFGDPRFVYGIAEAETAGHVVLRMAEATPAAARVHGIRGYRLRLPGRAAQLVEEKRMHAAELDRLLDANAFELAADPTRVVRPPPREEAVPTVELRTARGRDRMSQEERLRLRSGLRATPGG